MPIWEQLGMQAAGNVMGGAMGLILGGINDRRQLEQQKRLQNLEIQGNKQLTDYNFQKQMEMWRNTNYPAQMAMLKEAGLNPALLYSKGGAGGTTSISPGSVSGADAPKGGGEAMGLMGMGQQIQLIAAQTDLAKAQAEATRAGIPKIGAEIPKIGAETENLKADTANKQTQNELMQIERSILSIQEHIKGQTQNTAIATAQRQLEIATEQLQKMVRENKMGQETYKDNVQIIHEEAISKLLQNELTRINIAMKPYELHNLTTQTAKLFAEKWLIYKQPGFKMTDQEIQDRMNDLHDPNLTPQIKEIIGGIIGGILGGGIMRSTPNPVGFKLKQ